jgi:hypothetical protein
MKRANTTDTINTTFISLKLILLNLGTVGNYLALLGISNDITNLQIVLAEFIMTCLLLNAPRLYHIQTLLKQK